MPGHSDFAQYFSKNFHTFINVRRYSAAAGKAFNSDVEAVEDYLLEGSNAKQELIASFDPTYYHSQLSQPLPSDISLLEHYLSFGVVLGLRPIPLFDPEYVRAQEDASSFVSIFNYLSESRFGNIDPHPLFSRSYYAAFNSDVAAANIDPFKHYLGTGWGERRPIHPFIRYRQYSHYGFTGKQTQGEFNNRISVALESVELAATSALFDERHYRDSLGSTDISGGMLQHYLRVGWRLGGSPHSLFDTKFFEKEWKNSETTALPNRNPYTEYLSDFSHRFSPGSWLDSIHYRRAISLDPKYRGSLLEHFVTLGISKGASPSRRISTMSAPPSRYSGFQSIFSICDSNRVKYWLCAPRDNEVIVSHIKEAAELDCAVRVDNFENLDLHGNSRPVTASELSLISLVTACARCHCLVLSDAPLDDRYVSKLLSPTIGFVTSARPWLTLLSASAPTLRYWHRYRGCRGTRSSAPANEHNMASARVANVAKAASPLQLVLAADRTGIGALQAFGTRFFAISPKLSLLLFANSASEDDLRWLSEFVSMNFGEFYALVGDRTSLSAIGVDNGINWAKGPRILQF